MLTEGMKATTMQFAPPTSIEMMPDVLAPRLRRYLQGIAGRATPITYEALSKALQLQPPYTIHRLTEALECLMAEDAAVGRPFIAALVISRARGGLPALGFFDCAAHLGRFHVDGTGAAACTFHAAEFNAAVTFWGGGDHQEQVNAEPVSASGRSKDDNYAKFRNDNGVPEIRIRLKEFKCIGASPPHDHPHIYLRMGDDDTILCPYCGTLFRYDLQLGPSEVDPPDCSYPDIASV